MNTADNIILKKGPFDQYYNKKKEDGNLDTVHKLYHQYRGQTIAISEFHRMQGQGRLLTADSQITEPVSRQP